MRWRVTGPDLVTGLDKSSPADIYRECRGRCWPSFTKFGNEGVARLLAPYYPY